MTFSLYGLSGYDVQYWNGSAWTTVTGGSIGGNNKVWKKVTFATVATTKIRVSTNASVDGYSRIAELEAWGAGGQTQNVVWSNAVGVSTSVNSLTKTAATGWGNAGASSTQTLTAGDGYVEATVAELGTSRIFGFSHTDTNQSWDTIDFGLHCADDANNTIYVYESGTQRGTFGSYASGDKLRVAIVGAVVKYSRNGTVFYTSTVTPSYPLRADSALYENGATIGSAVFSSGVTGTSSNINWLVTDQLGTPRLIFDQSGYLATTKRHDYLPFGEDLSSVVGLRSSVVGYAAGDTTRQKFTQKERDTETGLDYFGSRYYGSISGRFISSDPFQGSAQRHRPQTWNRYSYALNSPLRFIDPLGLSSIEAGGGAHPRNEEESEVQKPRWDENPRLDDRACFCGYKKIKAGTGKVKYEWVNNPKIKDVPNNFAYIDTFGRAIQLYGEDDTNYHSWGIIQQDGTVASNQATRSPLSFTRYADTERVLEKQGYQNFWDPHPDHYKRGKTGTNFAKPESPTLHVTVFVGNENTLNSGYVEHGDPDPDAIITDVQIHRDRFSPVNDRKRHIWHEGIPN